MYDWYQTEEEYEREIEDEYNHYMSWMYDQIKEVTPNLSIEVFNEIINQPDFEVEEYVINKKIQIEEDKKIIQKVGVDWKHKLWLKWV